MDWKPQTLRLEALHFGVFLCPTIRGVVKHIDLDRVQTLKQPQFTLQRGINKEA